MFCSRQQTGHSIRSLVEALHLWTQEFHLDVNDTCALGRLEVKPHPGFSLASEATYVHGGVDLSDGLVVGGELVDLNSVADQLAGDLELELGQLALGDGVRLGDDWNDIYLQLEKWEVRMQTQWCCARVTLVHTTSTRRSLVHALTVHEEAAL